MKSRLVLLLAGVAALFSARVLAAEEGPVVIRNKCLEVRVDRRTAEVTILAKGKPVITKGRIGADLNGPVVVEGRGGRNASMIQIRNPVLSASGIALPTPGIVLLGDRPFVYIWSCLGNHGKAVVQVNKRAGFPRMQLAIRSVRGS